MKRILYRHGLAVLIVTILVSHWALLHWMAEKNIVTVLLSGGNQAGMWKLILAIVFVVIRLMIILLVPGLILYRLSSFLFDKFMK